MTTPITAQLLAEALHATARLVPDGDTARLLRALANRPDTLRTLATELSGPRLRTPAPMTMSGASISTHARRCASPRWRSLS